MEFTHKHRFVGLSRYRWKLLAAVVACATLGALIVWGKYEHLRPLAAVFAGAGATALGLLLLSLYPLSVGRNARAAPWKVGQVLRPGTLVLYGYAFVAGGIFVVAAVLISFALDILS